MNREIIARSVGAGLAGLLLAACADTKETEPADLAQAQPRVDDDTPAEARAPVDPLARAVAGDHRTETERARDRYRHPVETLQFFGFSPDMTVIEVFPGGGWYTKILAPALAEGGGQYIAAHFDPGDSARRQQSLAAFGERFADTTLFGNISVTTLGGDAPMAPPASADMVLTFRNVHNWMGAGLSDEIFAAFFDALKPGGVLGLVEHRAAPETPQDPRARSGYVTEAVVIDMATRAGFVLEDASEVNANPRDTRDHPFGVWTLPPVRRSSATRVPNPDFDRAKYDAIGESDRMTLRFRKPPAADRLDSGE